MRFRYLHRPHRRRKVTPEDIRFQILYRLFFRSFSNSSIDRPSTPGAPLFAFTFSYASQTSRFEISNGLPDDFQLAHASSRSDAPVDRTNTATDDPAPSLHPHYRGFTTTTSRSASAPRDGTQSLTVSAAWDAPSRHPQTGRQCRGTPSHVPCESSRPGSRRLHAGHHLASKRAPARLIPGRPNAPVSMSPVFRHFNSDSLRSSS